MVAVTEFKLETSENGETNPSLQIALRYNAWLAWARVALAHSAAAIAAKERRILAWSNSDEDLKAATLEEEFQSSLQAVVASAAMIDAFFAQLIEVFPIDPSTRAAWQRNRTARPTQVCETLRRTFGLTSDVTGRLKSLLDATYRIRDAALHSSGKPQPPQYHEELNTYVEWRFWTFRSDIANFFAENCLGLMWDLCNSCEKEGVSESAFILETRNSLFELLPDGRPAYLPATFRFWLP